MDPPLTDSSTRTAEDIISGPRFKDQASESNSVPSKHSAAVNSRPIPIATNVVQLSDTDRLPPNDQNDGSPSSIARFVQSHRGRCYLFWGVVILLVMGAVVGAVSAIAVSKRGSNTENLRSSGSVSPTDTDAPSPAAPKNMPTPTPPTSPTASPTNSPTAILSSDWISTEAADFTSEMEPLICSGKHAFVTQTQWWSQDLIGVTNVKITCSDGETLSATSNFQGNLSPTVSCPMGFDEMRLIFFSLTSGPNNGEVGVVDVLLSCEDDPMTRSGVTGAPIGTASDAVFCPNTRQVVGMQFVELDDPDPSIVASRFLCGGERGIAGYNYVIDPENIDSGTGGFYEDLSGNALSNGIVDRLAHGEIVGWYRKKGPTEGGPVVVGSVNLAPAEPFTLLGVQIDFYVLNAWVLLGPTAVEVEIGDQKFRMNTEETSDGHHQKFLNLPAVIDLTTASTITLYVLGLPSPDGRTTNGATYKYGISEVQLHEIIP